MAARMDLEEVVTADADWQANHKRKALAAESAENVEPIGRAHADVQPRSIPQRHCVAAQDLEVRRQGCLELQFSAAIVKTGTILQLPNWHRGADLMPFRRART